MKKRKSIENKEKFIKECFDFIDKNKEKNFLTTSFRMEAQYMPNTGFKGKEWMLDLLGWKKNGKK